MAYNASSTYMTFLMHSNDGLSYTKLVDIKQFPDLGQDPETLDTTTLTDKMRTSVLGIQGSEGMEFTANYDVDDYKRLVAIMKTDRAQSSYYAVWFGGTEVTGADPTPTGALGKFKFKGQLSVRVAGGGVDEVRDMSIMIAPTTPIEMEETEDDGE